MRVLKISTACAHEHSGFRYIYERAYEQPYFGISRARSFMYQNPLCLGGCMIMSTDGARDLDTKIQ